MAENSLKKLFSKRFWFTIDERIKSKLDGTLVVVEGIGQSEDAATKENVIVHHAFGVIWYDQQLNVYKFRSYLNDGRTTDAWLKVLEPNRYQWGFDRPQGKIRYHVLIDSAKKTWYETGEYSKDGIDWSTFFEMNLAKVE